MDRRRGKIYPVRDSTEGWTTRNELAIYGSLSVANISLNNENSERSYSILRSKENVTIISWLSNDNVTLTGNSIRS